MMATHSGSETIEALLGRVGRGDRLALGAIFQRDAGRLITVARRIVRRRELAEEIVQDAFVAIWDKAAMFDPNRGSGQGWLTTMVRNRALNHVRNNARMDYVDHHDLEGFANALDETHAAFQSLSDRDGLKACLDRLDEQRRTSILLAYVVGYTHEEIAAQLKAPLGTIKAWIRRGVVALQECLS